MDHVGLLFYFITMSDVSLQLNSRIWDDWTSAIWNGAGFVCLKVA